MSFHPLAQPVQVTADAFSFRDNTLYYPDSPIGWGAPDAPKNPAAISAIWAEVQPFGGSPVQSSATSGTLDDTVTLSVPVPEGVSIIHLYYGELIPIHFTVSADRLTLSTDSPITEISAISIQNVFPAKIESITDNTITLLSPLDGSESEGEQLFRYFDIQINLTPEIPLSRSTTQNRITPVANKLSIGTKTQGNGFNLKWTVNAAELTTAPKFVAIGSSTFAGSGASPYANSVGGKLATQLNVVAPGTGVLCNNAVSLQDTRSGLPNGADPLTKENKNISMALAANPTAIIIAFPTNDIGNGLTPVQFRDNIQIMYNLARQRGIPTFVISPQPRTGYNIFQQNALLTANALIKDIIPVEFYADVMEALRDPNSLKPADLNPIYNADNIHPNNAGHTVIYDILWNLISTYFTDPVYSEYIIESATVSGNGVLPDTWSLFDTVPTGTISKTYPRLDGDWHAYRISTSTPATDPSDPVWIWQPIPSSTVEQTVQIDLSLNTVPAPPADWNNFSAPAAGPSLNQSMALTDVIGLSSGMTATLTKIITGAGAGGANSGIWPQRVMQDNWYLSFTLATRGQLQLSGLLPGNVYNIEFSASRDTTVIDKMLCLTVSDGTAVDKRDSIACATAPNTPNKFGTRLLEGIVPTAEGIITIDMHCAGSLCYLTAMIVRRMSNSI